MLGTTIILWLLRGQVNISQLGYNLKVFSIHSLLEDVPFAQQVGWLDRTKFVRVDTWTMNGSSPLKLPLAKLDIILNHHARPCAPPTPLAEGPVAWVV